MTEALAAYGMLKAAGVGAGLDALKAEMSKRFNRARPAPAAAPAVP